MPKHASIKAHRHGEQLTRLIRCDGCGSRKNYALKPAELDVRDGVDPFFGLPLFLQATVGAHQLWAVNRRHVELLADYLRAPLRKRSLHPHHMTMMARLPRWLKTAHARPEMVVALVQLEMVAAREGLT